LKATMLISTTLYEMVIYPPGTLFDIRTMEVETIEGAQVEADMDQMPQRCIDICVHPAIWTRDKIFNVGTTNPQDVLVQSTNFVRVELAEENKYPPIVKAVVILREEPKIPALESRAYADDAISDSDSDNTSTLSSRSCPSIEVV